VMAFDVNDENMAIGTFEQPSNGKLMSCGSSSMVSPNSNGYILLLND
jgi:hypothetical protein